MGWDHRMSWIINHGGYPLVNSPITMENHPFYRWENPLFLWAMASIAISVDITRG